MGTLAVAAAVVVAVVEVIRLARELHRRPKREE